MRPSRWFRLALPMVLGLAGLWAPTGHAAAARIGFAAPVFVDRSLPGGEPVVIADPRTGWLIYAAHAGETHTDAVGLAGAGATGATVVSSRDQVFFWVSKDGGRSWQRLTSTAGFAPPATHGIGFSDPDLAVDAGGRVYATSINPTHDSLFSVSDGRGGWVGTPTCAEGDRPFIAAGKAGQVFLVTSNDVYGEQIYASLDGGRSCTHSAILDGASDGSWQGSGKPVYDPTSDRLFLPWVAPSPGGSAARIGVSTLRHPGSVWAHPPAALPRGRPVAATTLGQRWPSLAVDHSGTLYLVWDTSPTGATSSSDCAVPGESIRPTQNAVEMVVSRDHGRHWSAPLTIARPQGTAVWPWVVAGREGHAFVAWYQYDRRVAPLCAPAAAAVTVAGAYVTVTGGSHRVARVDISGVPIHHGALCSGVGCVPLNYDRRMGDLFDVALDRAGCVLVASGDTELPDPVTGTPDAWSHPLLIRQNSGPSLTTGKPCGSA